MKNRYLFVIFLGILFAQATGTFARPTSRSSESSEKETAIDSVYIALFNIKSKERDTLQNKIPELQRAIVFFLKQRSYWTADPIEISLPSNSPREDIKSLNIKKPFAAVLLGEIRPSSIRMALRRSSTGKTLSSWTIPITTKMDSLGIKLLAQDIAQTVIISVPYRGFVTAKRGNRIKLNIGKSDSIKQGTELDIFEFEKPMFSGERENIAKAVVINANSDSAIAEIKNGSDNIPLYSKVGFPDKDRHSFPGADQKYFDSFWMTGGGELNFIDTQATESTASLNRRLYQLTLTPFASGGTGYGPISVEASTGTAENASNSVSFLFAQVNYELLTRTSARLGFVTGIGMGIQKYDVQTVPNAPLPLISSQTYWPHLEQIITYTLSTRSRLFALGQLQIPKFSSDAVNGSSQALGSFGFKGQAGIRLMLTHDFGVEDAVNYQYSQLTFGPGTALAEIIYGFSIKAFYRF